MPITLNGTTGITSPAIDVTTPVSQAQGGTGTTVGYNGFKNRIINGDMRIDQRNAGASVATASGSNAYSVDRWILYYTQVSKFTAQQNSGSVTPPSGYKNYLGVVSSSAYTVTSTDEFDVYTAIEGFNTADLGWGAAGAATVTLSFWIRSSLTGTFGGALQNNDYSRTYPFSYTISSANTWEQKTITIPGDTTGTWVGATNAVGVYVIFSMGAGSTKLGTAGSWSSTGYAGATGQVNVVATNAATWYVTGVQLEKGSTATSFDYRPYGTELSLCYRYYWKWAPGIGAEALSNCMVRSATTAYGVVYMPAVMRAVPTIETTGNAANYEVYTQATGTSCSVVPAIDSIANTYNINMVFTVASGLTAGNAGFFRNASAATTAYLGFNAELT